MATGHRTAELRSIELHRLVAERLDEPMVERARTRVQEWLSTDGPEHPVYAQRWLELLARPVGAVAAALTEDTEEMRDMRQNSPFAGVLSDEERLAVIRRVR